MPSTASLSAYRMVEASLHIHDKASRKRLLLT
ncbi:hypothetical protein SVAN01_05589 [Stagonosporopsis vannaccii]|nr:hypothetical protein SVAN01_05589 [Stagonosporopsis vannaccii]